MDISKDGRWMLYGTDTSGDERYDFRIRDLETGDELEERLEGIGGAASRRTRNGCSMCCWTTRGVHTR